MTDSPDKVSVERYRIYKAALNITPDEDTETRRALKKAIYKAFDALIEQYELPEAPTHADNTEQAV